ncbi:MAG: hypothetical protein LBM26_00390 [Methanobrevibacter sp.]|jgi:ferritin|nr:hypothetical protein [Methanobrevibacter sp.]
METALNDQLNAEVYSGYLYLAMAAYFEDTDLSGFANWMRVQAQEELAHGTNNFLQWFVAEQVEEEMFAMGILSKTKSAIKSSSGLYLLDQELSQRIYNDPSE